MMKKSQTFVTIIVLLSIILLVSPMQSMSINDHSVQSAVNRQKRWTFNTWRLHGRRQSPDVPLQTINGEKKRKMFDCQMFFLLVRRSLFVKNSQILKSICRSIERQRTSRRNFTSIERKIRRKSSTRSSLLKYILNKKLQIKTFDFIEKKETFFFSSSLLQVKTFSDDI